LAEDTVASFGLTLANRGVIIGIVKAGDLIELAQEAEAAGAFDAVWVGDSLLAKPRLESVTLLGALAGATRRLRLGVGCLATFVHRHPVLFAQQWVSLRLTSWDQRGQLKRFLSEIAPAFGGR
jgi:alkanesulfonate monooxygenase SsuD/methylene tetrahydromethanopterin reductase-like flavin-dependent oxidoreductase (luciferase family)